MDRKTIVAVSRELIRERGFHDTSMRDIAARLGVSPSAVYNHFASKDQILFAVLKQPIEQLTEEVRAAIRCQHNPLHKFLAAYSVHIMFHLANPIDAGIFSSEYRWLAESTKPSIISMRSEYEEIFKTLVRDCMRAGALRKADVTATTNLLLGVPYTTTRWYRRNGHIDERSMCQLILDFVVQGIRGTRYEDCASEGSVEPCKS